MAHAPISHFHKWLLVIMSVAIAGLIYLVTIDTMAYLDGVGDDNAIGIILKRKPKTTPTPTITPTVTPSVTPSTSVTPTPTTSITPTVTVSPTTSVTPTPTVTVAP